MTNAPDMMEAVLTSLEVKLRPKDQYGTQVYYPANEAAELFAQIAGTTTLTPRAIKMVMQLGYTITYVHNEPVLP